MELRWSYGGASKEFGGFSPSSSNLCPPTDCASRTPHTTTLHINVVSGTFPGGILVTLFTQLFLVSVV